MKREELVAKLKVVLVGTDVKKSVDGFDTFVFRDDVVRTFNYNISVSYPLKTGVSCAVKAEDLFKVLSRMEGESISIAIKKNSLEIKDNKTTLKLAVLEDKVTQHVDDLKVGEIIWEKLPEGFMTGLELCCFSAARSVVFGTLTGVGVSGKDIVSTDNWRASWFQLKEDMKTFVIPIESAEALCNFEGYQEYGVDGESAWLHLKNKEGVIFSTRLFAAEDFPFDGIKDYFSSDSTIKYSFPEGIQKTLDRISPFAFSDQTSGNEFISISEEDGYIICRGAKDYGEVEEKIKVPDGSFPKGVQLNISQAFLKDILPKSRDFFVKEDIVIFDLGDFKHLITIIESGA